MTTPQTGAQKPRQPENSVLKLTTAFQGQLPVYANMANYPLVFAWENENRTATPYNTQRDAADPTIGGQWGFTRDPDFFGGSNDYFSQRTTHPAWAGQGKLLRKPRMVRLFMGMYNEELVQFPNSDPRVPTAGYVLYSFIDKANATARTNYEVHNYYNLTLAEALASYMEGKATDVQFSSGYGNINAATPIGGGDNLRDAVFGSYPSSEDADTAYRFLKNLTYRIPDLTNFKGGDVLDIVLIGQDAYNFRTGSNDDDIWGSGLIPEFADDLADFKTFRLKCKSYRGVAIFVPPKAWAEGFDDTFGEWTTGAAHYQNNVNVMEANFDTMIAALAPYGWTGIKTSGREFITPSIITAPDNWPDTAQVPLSTFTDIINAHFDLSAPWK